MVSRFAFNVIAGAMLAIAPSVATSAEVTIEIEIDGRKLTGNPLAWSDAQVQLLGRDGAVHSFSPDAPKSFRQLAAGFSPLSPGEMRGMLMREFGNRFEVSGAGRYLVVHPKGAGRVWPARFEALYRAFLGYFTSRGMSLAEPQFPLVAVVLHREQDFYRYAAASGANIGPGTLGYYAPRSNRILMYDPGVGESEEDWQQAAETIVHEAVHQTAFNTGVHTRFAEQPRWVVEGLGTMFEARGVWNSRLFRRRQDRLNAYRLAEFKRYARSREKGSLANFISEDRLFRANVHAAYAESWALTFYLSETRPRDYVRYLSKTAARDPMTRYPSPHRLQDFLDIFGRDLALLESQYLRFIQGL